MIGGQKFSFKLSRPFCRISTEKIFKFNRKTPAYNLPEGATYKPASVQLIDKKSFVARHQVFPLRFYFSGLGGGEISVRAVEVLLAGARVRLGLWLCP